jgi:hypothetical protein
MSRFRTDGIHITSPAGVWGYDDLIGATVRVKSRSISGGLFSVDSSSEYKVKSISFRLDIDTGKLVTIIGLDGLDGEYVWKDLELLKLDLCKCSRKKNPTPDKPRKEEDEKKVAVVYNVCNEEGVLVFSEERLQLVGEPAKLTQERPYTEYTYNTSTIKETTKKVVVNIKNSEYLPKGEYYFSEHFGVDTTNTFTIFNKLLGSSYGARFMVGDQNLAILGDGTVGMVDEVFEWEILHNSLDSSYVLIKAKGQNKYLTCYMNVVAVELKVIDPDSAGIIKSLISFAEPIPGNTPAGYEVN